MFCVFNICQNEGGIACALYVSVLSRHAGSMFCVVNICQNGGTCTDGLNGYTCDCEEDFGGLQCEIRKLAHLFIIIERLMNDGIH